MGLFSMLESFFFVTLGISCVLLMMLIYHFKQRINKLENNNRMMFDVINNMVQEMSMLKHSIQVGVRPNPEMNVPSQFNYPNNEYEKVDVVLNEEENDVDEYESDSESGEWESDDENSDTSTEVSESREEDETDAIKTIAVEMVDGIDETVIDSEYIESEELEQMEEIITAVELDTDESNMIQVNKLDDDSTNLEESSIDTQNIDKKSVYKKMTVSSLKALVIEKGLNTDPSKLKKNELLQLLESN